MGLGRLLRHHLEVAVAPVPPGETQGYEARRKQPAVGEIIDRRDELLLRQVARDAENYQRTRLRDPGQPPIERIAQRVAGSRLRDRHR